MTLRDLERVLYRRLGKNASVPNAETQARLRSFLNERHRRVLRMFPHLRDDTITFDTVASQQAYALPESGVAEIVRIWDPTHIRRLEQRDVDWLRQNDPRGYTGTPLVWIPQTRSEVHTQPSDASEVFVLSTSASDTNRAYIEGYTTGGYRRKAEITMTGTTAVSMDTTITTWIEIDKFYLSEDAVGTVTLLEDSGSGTELSKIAIGDRYAKYITFLLWPTPSAVITYSVDIKRTVYDLANPTDEPLLPEDFHDLLAIGARIDEYEHTDDSRLAIARVEWDEAIKALTTYLIAPPDRSVRLDREGNTGYSRLGAYFPKDVEIE